MMTRMMNNRTVIASSIRVLSCSPVALRSATVTAGPVTFTVNDEFAAAFDGVRGGRAKRTAGRERQAASAPRRSG